MKKIIILMVMLIMGMTLLMSQTYLSEDFEAAFVGSPGAPSGWSQTMNRPVASLTAEKDWLRNTYSGTAWTISSTGTNPVGAQSGTGVLWIDDYNNMGSGTPQNSRRMESPIVSLSGSTSPYIRFWYFNNQGTGVTLNLRVVVSADGGATWQLLTPIVNGFTTTANSWNQISVAVPAAYRTANFKFGFEITNRWGSSNPFIDNVSVEEYTPTTITSAQTGDWNVTTTWVGGVIPTANNHVVIATGHTVTMPTTSGIIGRSQNLTVDGILAYSTGTAVLLHAYGDVVVNGTLNAFNGTSGRMLYCGGNFTATGTATVNFSVGTTLQSTAATTINTGASGIVFMGNGQASFNNAGTLTAGRINNLLVMNEGGLVFNSAVTVPYIFGLYLGTVNPNGNLTLGNAPTASTLQSIERANGSFSADPIWNNTNITSRNNIYYSPNWVPLTQAVINTGNEIELVTGVRTITGTLTMNTHNNLQLTYPLTVGTATTGSWALTRGILITDDTNILKITSFVTTNPTGAVPSKVTPSTTHGSYVAGPVRRDYPATGTSISRIFPLGVGTQFNGVTPTSNVLKALTLNTGATAAASQSPTISIVGAPSGSANAPLTTVMGPRAYRVNLNGGADFPATATLTMNAAMNSAFGNSDELVGTQADLRIAQATALSGTWSARSAAGTGTAFVNETMYSRTTNLTPDGPIAPFATLGEYFAWATTAAGQTYTSSTTTQTVTTQVFSGSVNQQIIGIQVVTAGSLAPLSLTQFQCNTTGSTTNADIASAKIYSTGNSSAFATTTLFGSVSNPAASFQVNGTLNLLAGINYFWLTYDILASAPTGNVVDAECTAINVAGILRTPDVTAPAGSRTILNTTVTSFPYTESFDGTAFAPDGWGNMATVGAIVWDRQTAGTSPTCTPYSGVGMARYNSFSSSAGNKALLITPPINFPSDAYRVNFWMYRDPGYPTYLTEVVNVYYNSTPSVSGATLLGTVQRYLDVANWYNFTYAMPVGAAGNGRYVIFEAVSAFGNNMFIDHVTIEQIPAAPIFTYAPTSINFGTVMNAVQVGPQNVTITNTGGGTLNITAANLSLSGTNAAQFSFATTNLPAALTGGQSVVIPVYVTGTTVGPITATLTIVNNAINYDVALSANVLPAGIVTVGNGTANVNLPIYPYFGYTYSQSIFMQSELNVTNQRIEKIYYYWNGGLEGVASNDWTIYMGHTALNTFDTTTSWIPLANLSTVFTGTVALPAVAGWIEIPLTAPFVYNNTDNLVIAVDENEAGYEATSAGFFLNTAATTNRSIRYYSDTTNPDPAAPVAGTQVLGYPNVMLQFGAIPIGLPDAVTLNSPADLATDLLIGGFNLTWTPALTGGTPTSYGVFMSQDVETIFEDLYFPTTNQTFNPVTEGLVTFAYEDIWYWTVEAINTSGSAVVEPPRRFQIEAAPSIITVFPWVENFDAATTLPEDWTTADVDGAGTSWVSSITYSHSAPNAWKHAYSTTPTTGQNGWLITPAIAVPAGNYYLSWWNYNVFPSWLVYNGVKVNTTNNPAAPGWVELWSPTSVATAWSQAVVNISAYAGQTVYFAFNYQGYDADDWYVDDVSVYELLVDTFGPVITHLPIINTPREDINYLVYANIVDDATWNNPIGGATMTYSTNGGTTWSTPIAMALDVAPGYYAYIPAQPLGTTVTYKITAWDNLNNMTTTSNFAFGVNDPTWIWYDLGGTTYLGYTTIAYGPTVLYDNPFYGTGNAMQLLATDGSSYYGNAANLQIWTWDGVNALVPYFTTPIPVTFGAQTYHVFDLSTYNVQITTPYFLISYLDVPMGNYILFDGTYDYGTSYVFQGTTLYMMSNPGSWAIGANVQTGMALGIDAPVVTIALNNGAVVLSWSAITGASSYKVYGSNDPYAADPWTLVATVATLNYTYTGTEAYKFFKVTASSVAAPAGRNITSGNKVQKAVAPAITAPLIRNSMTTMKVRELPLRSK